MALLDSTRVIDLEGLKHQTQAGFRINIQDWSGRSALHYAASNGEIGITQMILANGGIVNKRDRYSYTPLHYAAEAGLTEMVKLLLSKGALYNMKTINQETPLCLAIANNRLETVKALLEAGDDIKHYQDQDILALAKTDEMRTLLTPAEELPDFKDIIIE